MVIIAKNIINPSKASIFARRYRIQIIATITAHFMTFSHGIALAWLSPTVQLLQSPESPVQFEVTTLDVSWIGSLFGLGCLTGNIIFGFLLDRAGRKWCMYLLAIPHMLFWILVYFASSVEYLYVARFLAGITPGGNYVAVPIFISEISDPNIRGALSSLAMLFLNFGILFGYVLSSYLDYHLMPCIIIVLPIIYIVAACFLPETPQFLLKNRRFSEAEQSFRFYKNIPGTSIEAKVKCSDFDELKEIISKNTNDSGTTSIAWREFITKASLKAFLTAIVLIVLNQFSGVFAFVNYMSHIFVESGSSIDPKFCTIVEGVAQIVGTCAGVLLVDRWGRKSLTLISALGMAAGLIAFAGFLQMAPVPIKLHYSWVPLTLMTVAVVMGNLGVVTLLFTVLVEILPAKIRSTASSICMGLMSCGVFAVLRIFPIFLFDFGVAITMFSCAAVCICCSIYLWIFLPETKGKSMDFDE